MSKHLSPKRYALLFVGVVISAVALYYALKDVTWSEFAAEFKTFNYWWLIPGCIGFYYSMYLRGLRWGLLFRPHYDLKGTKMFRPLMICFAFNSILPGRVGEVVRAIYVGKREGTGFTTAMATVVAERILDGVVLLAMLAGALAYMGVDLSGQEQEIFGARVTGEQMAGAINGLVLISAVLALGVLVFMIPATRVAMVWVIDRLPLMPSHIKHHLERMVQGFARGFHAIARPKTFALIMFHSVFLWVLVGLSNMVIGYGFDIDMSMLEAVSLVTLIGIAIALPAAPGYWGLYEAGGVLSLILLGVVGADELDKALAYIVTIHSVQFFPIVVVGLLFAWQEHIRPVEDLEEADEAVPNGLDAEGNATPADAPVAEEASAADPDATRGAADANREGSGQ